jgi:hypothetical protein
MRCTGAKPHGVGEKRRSGQHRGSGRAEKVADAPQGERRGPAVLHPGEQQQQARRGRNENGHDKQRVQIDDEM